MIILASKSPRRKQLLSMMGLEFTVQTADIDETMDPSQTPAHEVAAVSARKAEKIAALHPQDVIVSSTGKFSGSRKMNRTRRGCCGCFPAGRTRSTRG